MEETKNQKTKNQKMEDVKIESNEGNSDEKNLTIDDLIASNKDLSDQLAEYKKQFTYKAAEIENNRRIYKKDIENAKDYSVTSFASDMLQVLENLDRALSSVPVDSVTDDSYSGLYTGILLTKKEILNIFSRHGIVKIDAEGKKFDHKFHHAVKTISDKDKESDSIVEVLQDGYLIKDRILRPSMVVIVVND